MRRVISDGLMSLGAVVLLLLVLAAVDERVRDQFTWREATRPTGEIADAGARARGLATVVYRSARQQTEEHTALLFFVAAGVVLVLFMVRT